MGLATIALTVHTVTLNGAPRVVYRTWRLSSTPQATIRSLPGWQYSTTVLASYVSLISIAMITYVALVYFGCRRMRLRITTIFILPIFTTYLMLTNMSLNAVAYGALFTSSKSAEYVYIWSTVSILAFLLIIQYFERRFNSLGTGLLITHPDIADGGVKVDLAACFSLVLFLVTVLACLLWFGFIYDSTGTSNPSWIGVFGCYEQVLKAVTTNCGRCGKILICSGLSRWAHEKAPR